MAEKNLENSTSEIRTDIKCDLSICLITKNEEKYIENCLKALLPLKSEINCEIIVTDTGSTDKTVEIIEKYADKVLHFEWCNDFSAARNTGVDASSGAWFMFVDADEIFDESIMNIAKFIKSNNRDSYYGATFFQKNYSNSNDLSVYDLWIAFRLFNFTINKKYFINKIHEAIPIKGDNIFDTNAIADHYGYLDEVIELKKERNLALLLEEFENNKGNVRLIRYLVESVPYEEKLEYINHAFDLFEQAQISDTNSIVNDEFITIIYVYGCYIYKMDNNFEKLKECFTNFFNKEYMKRYNVKNSSVVREVYFISSIAYYENKDYELAAFNFSKFREIYKYIEKNKDSVYTKYFEFKFCETRHYNMAFLYELNCYDMIEDNDSLVTLLNEDDYNQGINIQDYIYFLIKYDQKNVACKLFQTLNQDLDIFNCEDSYLYFALKLLVLNDIDEYFDKYCFHDLVKCIDIYFLDNKLYKYDALYNTLKNHEKFSSLMSTKFILKLMEFFIINYYKLVLNDSLEIDADLVKLKVNEIFELYVKKMYEFVKIIYNEKILLDGIFEILEPQEVFAYIVYPGQKLKQSNQLEYVKSLKKGISYCMSFNDVVSNALNFIGNSSNLVENNLEFKQLRDQIKLTIIDAINTNQLQKAKFILEEYKKINPNDPYLDELYGLIS